MARPNTLALPDVVRDAVCYRLPLTPSAARHLAAALLADAPAERRHCLGEALDADASFALWCLLRAPRAVSQTASPAELLAWLAPRLPQELGWPPEPPCVCVSVELAGWLSAASAAADKAAELAGNEPLLAPAARWQALLHCAVDGLRFCGTPPPDAATAATVLPTTIIHGRDGLPAQFARADAPAVGAPAPGGAQLAAADDNGWARLVPPLAARLRRLDQLEHELAHAVEQEKLLALKEFAYGAGHEINNPLANISARAQTLLKDEVDPERRQKLAAINTQAFRAHEMIADLMLFARPPQLKPEAIDVRRWFDTLLPAWQAQAAAQHTELELRVDDGLPPLWADRAALSVALSALVANALQALGRGGRVAIAARRSTDAAHRLPAWPDSGAAPAALQLEVRDTGPGIPPEMRPRLFDPYFSGREAGRGLGFGLSKCWRIVNGHGGRIDAASEIGAGATFTVTLPFATVPPA